MGMTWGDLGNKIWDKVTPWDTGHEKKLKAQELGRLVAKGDTLTNPYDEHSLQLLQNYDAIASGQRETLAEKQSRELGQQMAAGVMGASKLRRGVSGAGTFSQAAQQAADVRKQGLMESKAIGQQQQQQAAQDALKFRAGKEAEKRQLTMSWEQTLLAQKQADDQAQATLTGSFLQTGASLLIGYFTKGLVK